MTRIKYPQTRRGEVVSALCQDGLNRLVTLEGRIGKFRWIGYLPRHYEPGRVRLHDDGTFTFKCKSDDDLPPQTVEEKL
jgi:hypothetical protein